MRLALAFFYHKGGFIDKKAFGVNFSNFFPKSILPFYCDQDSQKYIEIIWTKLNVETDLGQV